ncbi:MULTISPECIES: amino acid permease [unclassified Mycolicibacterium]|uniref:amino acid permease n=1 Tax=unclassified Mycolicibacterium TaxID=2636767 RepID=UPI0012DBF685|nr:MULTISPECIES: amino acid permease [unclassified Mycolicibacterium]MUL80809.1 amino acid permease [Mycolicibacterium sp. CBMA 329]MUL86576.1 amino acid permease [Mycolicibacterium sp. CBMA 331]MUM01437.1 amino acid permease [Mycolicibacterium sp. CBMA 334]MUM36872.1 amino acid permease [Mycolicibacterium sp. CBMA 247]MUM42640.1 amino acid permease [Mycolicibacterium sp. CBMA 294]
MTSSATERHRDVAGSFGDHDDLAEFGYDQQLHRRLGKFESFAAGFSFVSILTTIFQLFGLGFGFGGPAFFWTWPAVFLGQFLVALCFAELAARYPISGAVYQWSRRMGGEVIGWFGGWFMILAQIVTASAAAIALQVVLPSIWSGFQIIGEDPALTSPSGAANAVVLGTVLLVLTTTINCLGVKWMSRVNSTGVVCEIVGVIAVIGVFFTHAQRGPQVVFDTGAPGQQPGYMWAWIMSGLMAAYVMVGFGSAGELAEETRNPRRVAPRTIRLALSVSALGGGLMILGALMAAPSLTDGRLATEGLPYVLDTVLSSPWGTVLLVDVCIAIMICTLAIQTAASRLMFSMARDGRLPASSILSRVNSHTGTPIWPSVLIGLLCIGVLLVNVGNSAIFATLASVCIILIYLAYLLVTAPLLYRRIKGWPAQRNQVDAEGLPLFSLGKFGIAVNALAVLYGAVMIVNLGWPRAEIFNPTGELPILQWAGPLSIAAAVVLGALCFPRGKTHPKPVTIGAC